MDEQLLKIQKLLDSAEGNLAAARNLLRNVVGEPPVESSLAPSIPDATGSEVADNVIEGVFNGVEMISADGKTYPVPANYASKSKLVEGDGLKLTIAADGSFIFKQISPVERRNIVGPLGIDGAVYYVLAEGKKYKILTASVTFYKAEPGNQVTAIVPVSGEAEWAALENVIHQASEIDVSSTTSTLDSSAGVSTVETSPTGSDSQAPIITQAVTPETSLEQEAQKPLESTLPTTPSVPAPNLGEKVIEPVSDAIEPQIEFPAGGSGVSDEQLLENLKNNLKKMEAPQYEEPSAQSSSVATVAPTIQQTPPPAIADATGVVEAQPITELEI